MAEDAELPDNIQKIVDESNKDLKHCTTRELLMKLETLEKYVLDEVSEPFDVDDAFDHNQWLGDQLHRINNLLRERFGAANNLSVEDNRDDIERLEKENNGQQTAIDRLKNHKHADGEVVWRMQ